MKRTTAGWGSGLLGIIIFSGSLPATRLAVADLTPLFDPNELVPILRGFDMVLLGQIVQGLSGGDTRVVAVHAAILERLPLAGSVESKMLDQLR